MDEVAAAIADPVRREILLMLRDEPLSAGQIADRFAISRPAVSRHLRVLREAGLVLDTADGRRRVYTLVTEPVEELAGWLAQLTRPSGWAHRLDALETEVYRTRRERRTAAGRALPQPAGHNPAQATGHNSARAAGQNPTQTASHNPSQTIGHNPARAASQNPTQTTSHNPAQAASRNPARVGGRGLSQKETA